MKFQPHLLDEIRARLPVSSVVGRKVALKKKGREFAGLSPFKSEKTPSFFVNDEKGFYHCFATGEHGDIFTFVMKTEGLSFPEAVERLAEEAGVRLPRPEPRDRARSAARLRLHEAMDAAAQIFEATLQSAKGREARAYLERRGLHAQTIAEFRIGYAPAGRSDLSSQLRSQGFSEPELAACGLIVSGPEIAQPYDRFRDRVIFPIADLKGRVIAFGGRALNARQPAKYLNSPETLLFHKGHVLFNAANARQAAFDHGRVIVVEGYMDVVALAQAGFTNAVAPLGTAITGDQLEILWRMAAEPVLCFDGDAAGRKAAYRAVDVALERLKPGLSLRFAFLPDGMDPDDMLRQHGAQAFETVLGRASGLADVLWQREWSGGSWTTPERRAALETALNQLCRRISDANVRAHYQRDMRDRLYKSWRDQSWREARRGSASRAIGGSSPGPTNKGGGFRGGHMPRSGRLAANGGHRPYPSPSHTRHGNPGISGPGADRSRLLNSSLVLAGEDRGGQAREELICAMLMAHPWLIDEHVEDVAVLPIAHSGLRALRDRLLDLHARRKSLDSVRVRSHLQGAMEEPWVDLVDGAITRHNSELFQPDAPRDIVGRGWTDLVRRHQTETMRVELARAVREFEDSGDEADEARVLELRRVLSSMELSDASS